MPTWSPTSCSLPASLQAVGFREMQTPQAPESGVGSKHGDTLPGSMLGEGPQSSGWELGRSPKQRTTGLMSGLRPTHGGEGWSCALLPGTWRAQDRAAGERRQGDKRTGGGVAHTSGGRHRSPPSPSGYICHQQWVASAQHVTDWLDRKEPEDPQAPSATHQPPSRGGA